MKDRNGMEHAPKGNSDGGQFTGKTTKQLSDDLKQELEDEPKYIEVASTVNKTGVDKIEKGIKSINKRIDQHKKKIENPETNAKGWGNMSDIEREGTIKSWKKEIERFKREIEKLKKIIEKSKKN